MSPTDWATKAAEEIISYVVVDHLRNPRKTIASILAAHAEPLVALLLEAKREHCHSEDGSCCQLCFCNDKVLDFYCRLVDNTAVRTCTCGADEWNARIEMALNPRG